LHLLFRPIGKYSDRRGEDVEEFRMGDVYEPDETGDDMEIPEKVGIQFYTP
jgi:hypothetical protein